MHNSEPVVTIPAALAVLANAVLLLLSKLDVVAADVIPEVTAVVNGLVILAGLLLARRQVTPTFRAEHRQFLAVEAAKEIVARSPRPRPKQTRS